MPELPDVAGFQNYLKSTVVGKTIQSSSVSDDRILEGVTPRQLYPRIKDQEIRGVERHGKLLFVGLSSKDWLILHFGMTGEVAYFKDSGDEPGYTRFSLTFTNDYHLAYVSKRMLGKVSITEDMDQFIVDQELGPDALSDSLDREKFVKMLSDRRGNLKSALMNQSLIAGIGNVWADEILYQAGVHPETSLENVSRADLEKIYPILRRVLRVGARHPGRIDDLPDGYLLKGREGDMRCPKSHGKLSTLKVSGRTAYYCPQCQKKR